MAYSRQLGWLAAATCALLSACGGGGTIAIGSGQPTDPATIDYPVAYVKRTIPTAQDDLRLQRVASGSADLYVRQSASPTAVETNVTHRVTGTDTYDIKDVDVSADGTRFIFAMRGPLAKNQDPRDPPFWGIWEYVIATDTLRRVISSDTIAAEGNDISPHYLPDGRILFSSTRQTQSQATLIDEGKPGFEAQTEDRNESAFVLEVMNSDGTDIHQISFNQDHDIDATVLSDGRVMWSRWDHAPGTDGMHLYTANPDGTALQLLYGKHSHQTGSNNSTIEFVRPREMQDGRILALIRPYTGTDFGGDLTIIDTRNFVENSQAVLANTTLTGPAQQRATQNDVRTVPGPSPGGRFNSAFPLWDGTGRILVTWSQCRLLQGTTIVPCTADALAAANPVTAPPLYSAWIFDPAANTYKPVFSPVEGVMVTDLVAAQPRPVPSVILDQEPVINFDPQLQADNVGILDIRSVYDFNLSGAGTQYDWTAGQIATLADPLATPATLRPARFLRLEKAVSLPDNRVLNFNDAAFGATPYMREILGYAPIQPDGSVRIKVPANVAFEISVLDVNGQRIFPVHRNWLQLRPGETRVCNGCHNPNTTPPLSHGRDALFAAIWPGASATGVPFPNTLSQFSPNAGDTMAQTLARWSCANQNCAAMLPSVNVVYQDVWTDPTAAVVFKYDYRDLPQPLAAPTSSGCLSAWNSLCRIVINYVAHIHPIWSLPRKTFAADGVTVLSDHTCTSCHTPTGAANVAQVPAGGLDLTDGASAAEPLQLKAYRNLVFPHNQQAVNMGVLQDVVPNVSVPPPLSAGSAQASAAFFSRFVAGASHAGYLSPAELRLLSEWVDIGAQYFNNPFDPAVPLN